jgi:CRP-like cAMP-binding protein
MRKNVAGTAGKTALLKRASLFSQLSTDELSVLGRYSGYRKFDAGQVVFRQGSHREELYLVKDGSVSIRRQEDDEAEQEIARFVDGEVFGEMDLLGTVPRSASAVADGAATLLVFPDGIEFARLLEKHPDTFARILRKLLGEIARRIRAIDRLISEKTPWIEDLKRQLHRDRLTGLYNRAFLEEELPRIVAAHCHAVNRRGVVGAVHARCHDHHALNAQRLVQRRHFLGQRRVRRVHPPRKERERRGLAVDMRVTIASARRHVEVHRGRRL